MQNTSHFLKQKKKVITNYAIVGGGGGRIKTLASSEVV